MNALRLALLAILALGSAGAMAQEKVLNLYSARHYQTDESLYADFTRQTGIRINRIEGQEDALLERIRNEGANSPADVFLTVDAARLAQADALGLFAPVKSALLEGRIPAHLRAPDWFAFSTRARVIIYNKSAVNPADVQNYEDLAAPAMKGRICVRSGSHPYNLSLGSALIHHLGAQKTEEWARGLVANLARTPKGGDTDQIKSVSAGECGVAISNTYYIVRLLRSGKPEERKIMENIGVVWPNQKSFGTHINVSGGGLLKTAPHREAGVKFLEYLAGDQAQAYFANGNNEWPVVKSVAVKNAELESLGSFKSDDMNVGTLSKNTAQAQKIFDRAGWR